MLKRGVRSLVSVPTEILSRSLQERLEERSEYAEALFLADDPRLRRRIIDYVLGKAEEARRLFAEGKKDREIAESLGSSDYRVARLRFAYTEEDLLLGVRMPTEEDVVEAYRNGLSVKEVIAEVQERSWFVRGVLNRAGCDLPTSRRRIDPEKVRRLREKGQSYGQIARQLQVSKQSVHAVAKKHALS